jgi:predicted CXXCH cytochrome family protein
LRICLGLLAAAPAMALEGSQPVQAQSPAVVGRVPVPKPARGQGDKCVADTDWMRRNHMAALNHQRDNTVHDGIRTPRFSLKGCIDCHAVKGADGQPVTVADDKHFCRTCHDYTAVRVDCFECHASRPEARATNGGKAARKDASAEAAALTEYARSLRQ